MIKKYTQDRKMKQIDAEFIVKTMAQNEHFFVNLMLLEDLKIRRPVDDEASLVSDAFLMFFSYTFCGFIPLSVYLSRLVNENISDNYLFWISSLAVAFTVVVMGFLKSTFSTPWKGCTIEAFGLFTVFEVRQFLLQLYFVTVNSLRNL